MIILSQKQVYAIVSVGLIIFALAIVFIALAAAGITVGGSGGFDNSVSGLQTNTQYYLFPNSVYPGTDGDDNRTHTHCITGTGTTNFINMNSVGLDVQAGCALKDLSRFVFHKVNDDDNVSTVTEPEPIRYNSDRVVIALAQEIEPTKFVRITGPQKNIVSPTERIEVAGIFQDSYSIFRIADSNGSGDLSGEQVARKGTGGFTLMLSNATRPSGLTLFTCMEDTEMDPVDRKGCGIFPPGTTDPAKIKNSKPLVYDGKTYSTITVLGVGPSSSAETDGSSRYHAYTAGEIFV